MFDMGFAEILIIGIVALLVIGPERLPSVASSAGKWFGKIKRFVTNVRNDVEREFKTDELQKILEQQQEELKTIKDAMQDAQSKLDEKTLDNDIAELKKDIRS